MVNKPPWFQDKAFIVTGGTSGIGLAISKELLASGAKVISVSYNPAEFQPARDACVDIPMGGERLECLKCDISRLEDIQALKTQLEARIDLVGIVNNAGITTYGPFFKTDIKALNRLLQINFVGTVLFTREIFPLCLSEPLGKKDVRYITFTSSTSGIVPFPFVGGYPGTKAGVEMFLRTLEFECPRNVKVLIMRPGPVKTGLYDSAKTAPGANIKHIVEFSNKAGSLIEPIQVARPLVQAIIRKRTGAMFPDFSTRMLFGSMKLPLIGKSMIRLVAKELYKKFA